MLVSHPPKFHTQVNGKDVTGKAHSDVVAAVKAGGGSVRFTIVREEADGEDANSALQYVSVSPIL